MNSARAHSALSSMRYVASCEAPAAIVPLTTSVVGSSGAAVTVRSVSPPSATVSTAASTREVVGLRRDLDRRRFACGSRRDLDVDEVVVDEDRRGQALLSLEGLPDAGVDHDVAIDAGDASIGDLAGEVVETGERIADALSRWVRCWRRGDRRCRRRRCGRIVLPGRCARRAPDRRTPRARGPRRRRCRRPASWRRPAWSVWCRGRASRRPSRRRTPSPSTR